MALGLGPRIVQVQILLPGPILSVNGNDQLSAETSLTESGEKSVINPNTMVKSKIAGLTDIYKTL